MGQRIGFFELMAMAGRRYVEAWEYRPATGRPVRIWIGRLGTVQPAGGWFVQVSHELDPTVCADQREAEAVRHDDGVTLMRLRGPGWWERIPMVD